MDKRKRDSSPADHPEPPAKRPCTTSGSQRGGQEPSQTEVHAAQPQRSTSPQPSTSTSQQHLEEPGRRPSSRPSTSGYDSDSDSGYDSDSDSGYDSDSVIDFNIDSFSDSDLDEGLNSVAEFFNNFASDSDLDSQDERSSSPLMSDSDVEVDKAEQERTFQQPPSQEEEPEDPSPGRSSEPEPPPPGLQPDREQEQPVVLFRSEGVWVEEIGGQPVVHFPSGFSQPGTVEVLDMVRLIWDSTSPFTREM